MSTEEKQNSQTYQDSDSIEYPQNEREVASFIKKFYKSNIPVEIIGSGSKRKIGKLLQCGKTLSLSRIHGIVEYIPEELYIKVKASTPIKKIEEELKKNNQQLAFEPIDFGYMLKGKSDYGTAAGQVSCNISGPRRFKVGSVRDHVLGFRGVNGRGEIIKSGGVVVKNVTGYDLSKLICGSYGTLAVLTEITFKVLPAPEESKTLIIHNQKIESGVYFLDKSISSSNDISGAIFLPKEPKVAGCVMNIENTFKLNDLKQDGSITAIRIEGSKKSIDQRMENLVSELKIINQNISILESYQSEIFWNKVKSLEFFSSTKNSIIETTRFISHTRAEIGGLRAGIEAKDFTEADVADDITRLNDHIKVLQDNLEQQKKDLKQCEDDVSVLEAALQEATDEYEKVKGDEDALKTWIESSQ